MSFNNAKEGVALTSASSTVDGWGERRYVPRIGGDCGLDLRTRATFDGRRYIFSNSNQPKIHLPRDAICR
eukprot:3344502-Prymnesium_polylepis.2